MSNRCFLTGKCVRSGHNVSHSNRKTKRRFMINIKFVNLRSDALNKSFDIAVAMSVFKTINKYGSLDSYLLGIKRRSLTVDALNIRKKVVASLESKGVNLIFGSKRLKF